MPTERGSAAPGVIEAPYAPGQAVRVAATDDERHEIFRLRYRVFVHEQGKRRAGMDAQRKELTAQWDPLSVLWYAHDGMTIVGTMAQTIIGPDFDVSPMPAALELASFPRTESCKVGYSSRFAIAPEHRSAWVLPSLARSTYRHGRALGAKFDIMLTNPGLVPLFERLGYVRYTASGFHGSDHGLLLPMVLPASDHQHLRNTRSACLPAASAFPDEPQWGEWLRNTHPIINTYYGSELEDRRSTESLARQMSLPVTLVASLRTASFIHRFPAGTPLVLAGDRVTCGYFVIEGRIAQKQRSVDADWQSQSAPDGVPFADSAMWCETDVEVLCVPTAMLARAKRRHPELAAQLDELMQMPR
ncbi:MAG: cyclic nucleotide-binding domain-containing protein [bacterium]